MLILIRRWFVVKNMKLYTQWCSGKLWKWIFDFENGGTDDAITKKVVFPPNTEWWTKPLSEWFMKLKS